MEKKMLVIRQVSLQSLIPLLVAVVILPLLSFGCQDKEHKNLATNPLLSEHTIFERGELLPSAIITGKAWHKRLVKDSALFPTVVGNEVFEAGSRNVWHSHPGGQIIIVTHGVGYHQLKGQPIQVLRKGDVVKCPPGVVHWHGASKDSSVTQIYILPNTEKGEVRWFARVTDEEYNKADAE